MGADVEAWWHLGLEHRPASRPVGADLERQTRARDPLARAGRQYQSVGHASSLPSGAWSPTMLDSPRAHAASVSMSGYSARKCDRSGSSLIRRGTDDGGSSRGIANRSAASAKPLLPTSSSAGRGPPYWCDQSPGRTSTPAPSDVAPP